MALLLSSSSTTADQLIVYTALLEHLLLQKLHYENELDLELKRLERFKGEGFSSYRLQVQKQVVKQVQAMLPGIVYKMRNDLDTFERFLHTEEQQLKQLNKQLVAQGWQLLRACRENLEQTP